ncbi:MAG: hypothetical protein AB1467_04335 [Candidatus Diapherotrites archaeon]
MKGSFLIKAKEPKVITEKGVRAFIMERLLNSPFNKGSVINVDEKTVQVQLDGDEKQIKLFMQKLEKDLVAQFGNPSISFTLFQENPALEIPDLMRSSQALMVGQLQKGISVQLDISQTLREMSKELRELPRELAKILKS